MSESTNPYQAPLTDSVEASHATEPGDFIPGRMEFRSEITPQHHRDAVVKAGIRKEFRHTSRMMLTLSGLFTGGVVTLLLLSGNFDPSNLFRTIASALLFVVGVVSVMLNQRWLVGRFIPSYQLAIGQAQGWIDRDGLWIETEDSRAYFPLSQLVSCAATHDIWAFSFGKDHRFWQTIPLDGFDDASLARRVASDLQRLRPPVLAQLVDERKRMVSDEVFRFTPGRDAIEFQGSFYVDSIAETQLKLASSRIARRTWYSLILLLGCVLGSILILTGFQTTYVAMATLWVFFLVASVYFRIWRARRSAKENGRVVAWWSKGWLDDQGYCAMTSLGQSRFSWRFFDHFEITRDVIGLYPHTSNACCCLVGREQFSTPSDWAKATEMVQRRMAAAVADR